jgi:glycosyltransferase involved in cell wall biosynthesis
VLPNVSVVIPSYKSSSFLEATLESVVKQTYPRENLEVLVIDDASPDASVEVARRFLAKHSLKSRVIAREVNAGAGASRNVGWRMADGDWIQFLDQDDILATHKIEQQAKIAAQADEKVAVV